MSATALLAGSRIAVTSTRGAETLLAALEQQAAHTVHVPLAALMELEDSATLAEKTRKLIAARPQVLVFTSAQGLHRWFDAAEAAGLGGALHELASGCRIYARGQRTLQALQDLGLAASSQPSTPALLRALAGTLDGQSAAVQLHESDRPLLRSLRSLGARRVLGIEPCRWLPTRNPHVVQLVQQICDGALDAVVFTSAPAAHALLAAAKELGQYQGLLRALNGKVVAATVGAATAEPLIHAAVARPLIPEHHRLADLLAQLGRELAVPGPVSLQTAQGLCTLSGRTVQVAGKRAQLSEQQARVLRRLLEAGGHVVPRSELAAVLGGQYTRHAMDMMLSRLRKALPVPGLVATVIKRGYRIE